MTCHHCGVVDAHPKIFRRANTGGAQLEAFCSTCGQWLKWVSPRDPIKVVNVVEKPRAPETRDLFGGAS